MSIEPRWIAPVAVALAAGCALDGRGRQRTRQPRDCPGDRDRRGRGDELRRRRRSGAPDGAGVAGGRLGRRARRPGGQPRQGRPGAGAARCACCRAAGRCGRGAGPGGARRAGGGDARTRAPTPAVPEELHQPGGARPRRGAVQGRRRPRPRPSSLPPARRARSPASIRSRRPTTASSPTWRWCSATWRCPAVRC